MSPPKFRHQSSLRKRFSSIEPRSPTSPHSPNGHHIYTVPDHDDDVFENETNVPKSVEPTIIPPPPTPGTSHPPAQKGKKKFGVRDIVLTLVAVVLVVTLTVATALAIILVNTKDSVSSSSSTPSPSIATSTGEPSEVIQYTGHLTLSRPWDKPVVDLEQRFLRDVQTLVKSSHLYKAFIKSSLLNTSANGRLYFTLDFRGDSLKEVGEAGETTAVSTAKTVENILREQVVKNAGNIILPIMAESIVILENIPVSMSTTASTTMSFTTTSESSMTTERKGQCLPMRHERCLALLGSSFYYLPNIFNHFDGEEAENTFKELAGPDVDLTCSGYAVPFLCSVLFPPCNEETLIPMYPCDKFCKVIQDNCIPAPKGWPLNCEQFSVANCLHLEEITHSTTISTTEVRTTTKSSTRPPTTLLSTTPVIITTAEASTTTPAEASSTSLSTSTMASTTERIECVPLDFPTCNVLGFQETMLPNHLFECENIECLKDAFYSFANDSIMSGCTSDFTFFCGFIFSACDFAEPCQETCHDAEMLCGNFMPFPPDCSYFPLKNNEDNKRCFAPRPDPTTTTTKTASPVHCVDNPSPICSQFGYSKTIFPNLWGDHSAEQANDSYYMYAEAAVSMGCSPNVLFYVCTALFPYCEGEGNVRLPCTTYCEEVKKNCPTLFPQNCTVLADSDPSTCLSPPEKIACQATSFTCVNINKCVPQTAICNKINDCGDWSDERNCECNPDFEVKCGMGLCLPSYHRCDGQPQCPDNSDENQCDAECKMNQYRCKGNGPCIMNEWLCDGVADCYGLDDEEFCHNCEVDEFMCVDKTCIPHVQICDGSPQCPDHTDEMNCILLISDDEKAPFFVRVVGDIFHTCSEGFTDNLAETVCHRLGEDSVKKWMAVPAPPNMQYIQLDPTGNNYTVMGNGKVVINCPDDLVAAVECTPKECGHPHEPLQSFIINGQDAKLGAWPWMVSIRKFGIHECGGAIIHPYFILTAAHCIDSYMDYESVMVVAGTTTLSEYGQHGQWHLVRRTIVYPGYQFFMGDDIAMIELKTPFEYNDFVQPLCLPDAEDVFSRANECYLAGWGHTIGTAGAPSEILQQAKLSLWDTSKCNSSYMWNGRLLSNEMCAGYFNGLISACSGDSGSPMMCKDTMNTWKVVGVASYVYKKCNVPTKPMVFTQTQPYVEWILNHTVCQFTCANGICLFDKSMLCDTVDDCGDRTDEVIECDIQANCTFYDKFLCGYTSKWQLVSNTSKDYINHFPLFDHTMGKYPGKYLLGRIRGEDINTPRIDLTTAHCFRFHYHMRGEGHAGMAVSAHELQLKKWIEIWEEGTIKGPDKWLMGTFDLAPGHYDIVFRPHDNMRFALDDIWLLEGTCDTMKCLEEEFMCNTFGTRNCLPLALKCNVVKDCDNGEDEIFCTGSAYKCDFENGNICGLEQHSDDSAMSEWTFVNSSHTPLNLQDHTYENDGGMLLMIDTQELLSEDHVLMSHNLWLGGRVHCLKFYYASTSPALLLVTLEWGNTLQTLINFPNRITSGWILTQATLPPVPENITATLTYSVIGGNLGTGIIKMSIMLDDITITNGQCSPFSCPPDTLLCEDEAYCLPQNKVCDRVIDCNKATDEIQCVCNVTEFKCPTGSCIPVDKTCDTIRHCPDGSDEAAVCDSHRSVSCDFEHPFLCGYKVNTSYIEYHWSRTKGQIRDGTTGPSFDHTYGDGHLEGYYVVADRNNGGEYTALTSPSFVSTGNGLVFYYHARHFLHAEQMTGRLSLIITKYSGGMQEQTEVWYIFPDNENNWKLQCIDLPKGNISLTFVAQKGSGYSADMALDDIKEISMTCDMFLTAGRLATHGDPGNPGTETSSECTENQRKCTNGMCLDIGNFCDGIQDCLDGHDEAECDNTNV